MDTGSYNTWIIMDNLAGLQDSPSLDIPSRKDSKCLHSRIVVGAVNLPYNAASIGCTGPSIICHPYVTLSYDGWDL